MELAPTTGPRELPPLDRASLPEVDGKWNTPEWQNHRRRVMDELWATRLGQMYLAYMTDDVDPITIPGRAMFVVTQVFTDGDKVGSRTHVLRMFYQDLYARRKSTPDMDRRMAILEGLSESCKTAGQEETKRWISIVFGGVVAGSIPFGSPLLATKANTLFKIFSGRLLRRDVGGVTIDTVGLKSPRAWFKGYRYTRAGGTAMGAFGAVSTGYFFWYDWLPGWRKNHKYDPLLNDKDHLLEDASS